MSITISTRQLVLGILGIASLILFILYAPPFSRLIWFDILGVATSIMAVSSGLIIAYILICEFIDLLDENKKFTIPIGKKKEPVPFAKIYKRG